MKANCLQFPEYGRPTDVLTFSEHTLPEPGPGQAVVKILAIGMNRSELNYTMGKYVPARAFPSCVGQEAVGEIIALGAPTKEGPQANPATPLEVGAKVALLPGRVDMQSMGTYRDVGIYDQAALAPIPDDFNNEEAAAYWMGILTMGGCLELAGLNPDNAAGKKILITAATSSMGVIGLKLAKAWGATTIATSRSADKAAQLADLADHVVICDDSDSLIAGVNAATKNQGVDLSLDPVGAAFYPGLITVAAQGGQIISYEMLTGRDATISIPTVMIKDLALRGFALFRVYQQPGLLETLIEQGMKYSKQVRPIVSDTFALSDAASALETLETSNHIGKLVLLPA
ncbi:zinc-binding dehydrogenase [Oceanicoccus sp. KOV_DT_Chl]|uniref:quinone oxidoreductase family protein n=1 Tax=Oceanicoccus sp. KOV_DT_Chl TaxID=1904639 RepID=UPI000C7E209D|nr:zinc-binding dehydrogenase [Oceanicoccus sp. KOV_DT_Chl]